MINIETPFATHNYYKYNLNYKATHIIKISKYHARQKLHSITILASSKAQTKLVYLTLGGQLGTEYVQLPIILCQPLLSNLFSA